MEEAEKMTAWKKAYAEIILNTAKEAAARVMVSERRAQQCNYDLDQTKEEALRLLVRLKQAMEFKINEVEIKSVNQGKRIDELEAQLQEAEDIVTNLRGELNEVYMKLEVMVQSQLCNQSNVMEDTPFVNELPQVENRLSEAILASQANLTHNGASNGHLVAHGHSVANNYGKDHGYTDEPDFPSIIMRSKKSELNRNGCTQRIQACEANILDGPFSLVGGLEILKTAKAAREDTERKKVCLKSHIAADISLINEEKVADTEVLEEVDRGDRIMNASKSCRKKRKRATSYRRFMPSSIKAVPPEPRESQHDLSDSQCSLPGSHDMHDRIDNKGKSARLHVSSPTPSNISEIGALPKLIASADFDVQLTEPPNNGVNEDRELSSLVLIRQQKISGDDVDALVSRTELEMKNSSSENLDAEQMEISSRLPSPQPKDRVLKYTFQRKRKKESTINDIGILVDQENSLRNEMTKKHNGDLEPSIAV